MNRQYNTKAIYTLCVEQGIINKDEFVYKDFYNVIREFHKEIAKKIINDQYKFKPSQIGIFEITKDIRRGQSINWGASNKRKQEIIDSGLVPYNKENSPEGIEWFIYHEGGDYYKWRWFKDTGAKFISNIKYYNFQAARANLRGLAKAIKENPFASLEYGIHR
jgi:hypothetical protein